MKTPWSDLLQYGVVLATIVVLLIAGIIVFSFFGFAVFLGKLWMLIK
jgi:hypothetical protein